MRLCHHPECENYCEGTTDYCASHNHEQRRSAKDAIKLTKQQERKRAQRLAGMKEKRTPIKNVSDKRSDQMALYLMLKNKWIQGKLCVCCGDPATECHHAAGRENHLLLTKKWWKPVCRPCHQLITEDSAWAISQGYSIRRNSNSRKD